LKNHYYLPIFKKGDSSKVKIKKISFLSEGETIRGHLLLPSRLNDRHPAIIKCHGLPGSPNQVSGIASELAQAGFVVLTFNFRGIRHSNGLFSYAGEIIDAGNGISFLEGLNYVDRNRIAIYGASFGGAVAICRAAIDMRITCIAVRAPVYDTERFIEKLTQNYSPKSILIELSGAVHGIKKENFWICFRKNVKMYNPMDLVSKISPRALLVVTGDEDKIIGLDGVKDLFERAKEPKTLKIVSGADHKLSNPIIFQQTNKIIIEWFRDALQVP